MRKLLRDGWAWSASPAHAASQRRRRHLAAAAGTGALLVIVLMAPVSSIQRVALAALTALFGLLSGLVRDQHATVGGRLALQGVVSVGLAVGVLAVSPALWPVAVAIAALAVVRATALQGAGAGMPLLVVAAVLLVAVALTHGVPVGTLWFAAMVGSVAGAVAVGSVADAVADRHRMADGLNSVDRALVAFADASVRVGRDEAVRHAVEVMLPDTPVHAVEVRFGTDGAAGSAGTDDVTGFATTGDAPVVRLMTSDGGREVVVGLPMRSAGRVVGAVTLQLAHAPRSEELQLLDVLTDRLTATLSAEVALERERAARRKLEEADRLRDQVMARVTHDLRAPLSSISGSVFTLTEYADELSPEAVRQLYDLLQRNADRVTDWVQSLLEHAVHGEEVELSPERIAVAELLDGAVEAASQIVAGFDVRCTAARGSTIVDVTAVTRVLVNLLQNATKYAPAGSPIELRADRDHGLLTVVVSDHGTGVREEDQPHLFEPFYRSARQPPQVHGTGLGLATVRELVAAWGGEVGHRPTRGGGATFWFTVPEPVAITPADRTVVPFDTSRRRGRATRA